MSTTENTTTETELENTEPETPETDDGGKAGREAAKYRRQLREVEAERDTLLEKITELEAAEAERERAALIEGIAAEFEISAEALRGSNEEELRAHAEVLSRAFALPAAPVVRNAGDTPKDRSMTAAAAFAGAFKPREY